MSITAKQSLVAAKRLAARAGRGSNSNLLPPFAASWAAKQERLLHGSTPSQARVLATDGVDPLCVQIFKDRGHQVDLIKTLPEAELNKIIGDYDGLVVRSATKASDV
jgi:hypothetical protein